MNLVLEPTSTAQWHTLVSAAEQAAEQQLDETLESYLVFLLMRFASRPDMASRVMAIDYLEGVQTRGRLGQERLRDVGDHCLLFSGLFPRLAERRLVRLSYFVGLGRSAYAELGERIAHGGARMYAQLAQGFVNLMDVLQAMRRLQQGVQPDLLQAIEVWQETGSKAAHAKLKTVVAAHDLQTGDRRSH